MKFDRAGDKVQVKLEDPHPNPTSARGVVDRGEGEGIVGVVCCKVVNCICIAG